MPGPVDPVKLHRINGLFDCHRSRMPLLAIVAQIPNPDIGRGSETTGLGRTNRFR